jgi:hypothetical protein
MPGSRAALARKSGLSATGNVAGVAEAWRLRLDAMRTLLPREPLHSPLVPILVSRH